MTPYSDVNVYYLIFSGRFNEISFMPIFGTVMLVMQCSYLLSFLCTKDNKSVCVVQCM